MKIKKKDGVCICSRAEEKKIEKCIASVSQSINKKLLYWSGNLFSSKKFDCKKQNNLWVWGVWTDLDLFPGSHQLYFLLLGRRKIKQWVSFADLFKAFFELFSSFRTSFLLHYNRWLCQKKVGFRID